MIDELDGLATFVAVAECGGFRAAGERLGISHSAVSQAVRRLEARLGAPLVRRTTRSVHLTEAGERYYAAARTALEAVREASAEVGELGQRPQGTLRLHAASPALMMISESLLPSFLADHPSVNVDLVVSESPVDVIAEGFDAGIQLGEVIHQDMIAVPITGDLRMVVVGAPAYFERRCAEAPPRPGGPRLPQLAFVTHSGAVPVGVHRQRARVHGKRAGARAVHVVTHQPAVRRGGAGRDDGVRRPCARGAGPR